MSRSTTYVCVCVCVCIFLFFFTLLFFIFQRDRLVIKIRVASRSCVWSATCSRGSLSNKRYHFVPLRREIDSHFQKPRKRNVPVASNTSQSIPVLFSSSVTTQRLADVSVKFMNFIILSFYTLTENPILMLFSYESYGIYYFIASHFNTKRWLLLYWLEKKVLFIKIFIVRIKMSHNYDLFQSTYRICI